MTERHVGEIVTVRGYAGWAKIMGLIEDGEAFGHTKYLANVRFHPNDKTPGHKRTYQFPAGRLEPVASIPNRRSLKAELIPTDDEIDEMTDEELTAMEQVLMERLGK